MKRVLVTGATGFIGYEVAHQLCKQGLRPRLMVRRPSRGALFARLPADLVQGDLSRPATLTRAVEGVDTVIHLGARATFEPYARLRKINVEGTDRLMEASIDAGVERFVFASSMFVYGSVDSPVTPDTKPIPELDYGRAKLEAEGRLREVAGHAGIQLASVRLPHVYGPQSILFHQIRAGLTMFPGSMKNEFSHLHVEDAARALIAVAEQGWTGESVVSDYQSVSWVEFFDVLRAYYPRFHLLRVPAWFAHMGATALAPLLRLRGGPTMYTRDTIRGFNLHLPAQSGLLWSDLGIEPQHKSIYEGVPAALDGSLHFRWRNPVFDRQPPTQDHDIFNTLPTRA